MTENDLILLYRPLAFTIARDYFFPGADRDDVRQEALIGVMYAIRSYRSDVGTLDKFVPTVVRRHLQSCLKAALTNKYKVLSLSYREELKLTDLTWQPEEAFLRKDTLRQVIEAWHKLTPSQKRAMLYPINGEPYTGNKTIDSGIQRARKRLKEIG